MNNNLASWIDFLEKIDINKIKLGLERMQVMLKALSLEAYIKKALVIEVAGTNGKGSCASFLSECLRKSGRSVGLYTSPHLKHFTERVRINGAEVAEELLCDAFAAVKDKADETQTPLTYFEFTTLAALIAFEKADLEVLVLEIGLGGRLDAVNAVDADLCLIPSIGFDHMAILGNTLTQIAGEKAGIIKPHSCVVTGLLEPEALAVIESKVQETASSLYSFKDWSLSSAFSISIQDRENYAPAQNSAPAISSSSACYSVPEASSCACSLQTAAHSLADASVSVVPSNSNVQTVSNVSNVHAVSNIPNVSSVTNAANVSDVTDVSHASNEPMLPHQVLKHPAFPSFRIYTFKVPDFAYEFSFAAYEIPRACLGPALMASVILEKKFGIAISDDIKREALITAALPCRMESILIRREQGGFASLSAEENLRIKLSRTPHTAFVPASAASIVSYPEAAAPFSGCSSHSCQEAAELSSIPSSYSLPNAAHSDSAVPQALAASHDSEVSPSLTEIILDVAHNVPAARNLRTTLLERFGDALPLNIACVVGMLKDKDIEGVMAVMAPLFKDFYVSSLGGVRGEDASRLVTAITILPASLILKPAIKSYNKVSEALAAAIADGHEVILVFGSFHTAGEARDYIEAHQG